MVEVEVEVVVGFGGDINKSRLGNLRQWWPVNTMSAYTYIIIGICWLLSVVAITMFLRGCSKRPCPACRGSGKYCRTCDGEGVL